MLNRAGKPQSSPPSAVLDVAPPEQSDDPTFILEAHRIALFYVRFIRRHRLLLIGLPLLATTLAVVVTWLQPRQYEATVTMMSSGTASVATYVPYLQNHRIVDGVIRDFKLAQPPHRVGRTEFFRSVFNVEAIRNTNLLTMSVRLRDPELAANVLNRISADAIDLVRRTNADNAISIRNLLRAQLEEARAQLEGATSSLLRYREQSQIELLRRDIDAALEQRGQLLGLFVEIEETRSRLARAQAELEGRSRVDTLRRTIDESPLLMEAARSGAGAKTPAAADAPSFLGLELRSDSINQVYDALDAEIATTKTALAGLEQKRDQLVKGQGIAAPQMANLSRLYSIESELARLELEQELRRNVFTEVSNRYELARLDVVKHGELFVVDPALPADLPLGRGTVRNAAGAFMAGLVLAVAIIILRRGESSARP